jgi:hypothetical protein
MLCGLVARARSIDWERTDEYKYGTDADLARTKRLAETESST